MRLLFLIVFIGLNAFSQKIDLGDLTNYQNSSLDTLKQEFHVYLDDHMLTINLNNFEKTITPLALEESLPPGPKYIAGTPFWIQNTVYFPYGGGGLMYSIENDTIKRIDNSFDHGMQYGASTIQHDGTIFKYGGYGFWSARDFFTYYDKNQNEWEVYHPIASEIIPQGRAYNYFIKYKNRFHIFGGTFVNPNNRREQPKSNEVWTFDFNSKEWSFLGKHDDIETPILRIPYKDKLIMVKKNHMTVIDVQNNSRTIYKHSPISAQVAGIMYVTYTGGKFYVVLAKSTGVFLNIVEEEDFIGPIVEQKKFYKNQSYWLKQGVLFILAIFIILLALWFLKNKFVDRNKIKLLDTGLRYHLQYTEFDKESMAIIRLLLSEKEVSSSKILQIVEKEQYSPAHNERIKVQKINDINIKVATLLGIQDDLITNFKSSQDRRIRLYKISKEYFRNAGIGMLGLKE